MALDDPAVRRDSISSFENNHIAYSNIFAFYDADFPVAHDLGRCGCHLHERFHCSFGFALLYKGHHRIYHNDHKDDQHIGKIRETECPLRFNNSHYRLDCSRGYEHDDHRICDRTDEFSEKALLFRLCQLVPAVLSYAFFSLFGAETFLVAVY